MTSPLQRRRARLNRESVLVKQAIAKGITPAFSSTHSPQPQSDWSLVRGTLAEDKRKLKNMKQHADKIAFKARVMPHYRPYLDRTDAPNDFLAQMMVWLFDINDLATAIPLAEMLIDLGATMPEGFKSEIPDFVADMVFNWTVTQYKAGHSVEPYFSQIFKYVTEVWKPYEIVMVKYYKQAGLMVLGKHGVKVTHVADPELLQKALALFEQADAIYTHANLGTNSGVGTRITQIKKRLARLSEGLEPESNESVLEA